MKLSANLAEVMQVVPQVQVEIIFDAFHHYPFPNLSDVVVRPWVMRLVIRHICRESCHQKSPTEAL